MRGKTGAFPILFWVLATLLSAPGGKALAQSITPAHEQEFTDAKNALDAAQKAQADKYAPESLKQAQDLLVTAGNARSSKDAVKFAQTSRLARAYAELARAIAELRAEEERLAAAQAELERVQAEIERLRRTQ